MGVQYRGVLIQLYQKTIFFGNTVVGTCITRIYNSLPNFLMMG